jgi:hypothetical protein
VHTLVETAVPRSQQHRAAVSSILESARKSADPGDYAESLRWVRALEAIGQQNPPRYQAKPLAWNRQPVANSSGRGSS